MESDGDIAILQLTPPLLHTSLEGKMIEQWYDINAAHIVIELFNGAHADGRTHRLVDEFDGGHCGMSSMVDADLI